MINRIKQLGSVKTFFIVGAVLAFILIGSAVYVKNHGESVRKGQIIDTSENQTKTTDNKKTDTTDKTTTTDNTVTNNPTVQATNDAEKLPTTGPESFVAEAFALFVFVYLSIRFLATRRA